MDSWHIRALHNPDQGEFPRVLFVCHMGALRSATAAHLFASKYRWNTRCAGVALWAVQPVTESVVEWADTIVTFDLAKTEILRELGAGPEKLFAVYIPDYFDYRQKELEEMLEESVMEALRDRTPDSFKVPAIR